MVAKGYRAELIKRMPYLIAGRGKCLCNCCHVYIPCWPAEGIYISGDSFCDIYCLHCKGKNLNAINNFLEEVLVLADALQRCDPGTSTDKEVVEA